MIIEHFQLQGNKNDNSEYFENFPMSHVGEGNKAWTLNQLVNPIRPEKVESCSSGPGDAHENIIIKCCCHKAS